MVSVGFVTVFLLQATSFDPPIFLCWCLPITKDRVPASETGDKQINQEFDEADGLLEE